MRLLKTVGGAGALIGAALIGGTLISSALAANTGTADPSTVTVNHPGVVDDEAVDTFLDTLAAELGVDRADLGPAALAAANAVIDAKLAAGDIDEERAAALKERLAELDDPEALIGGRGILGHGPGGFGPGGFGPGRGIALGIGEAADAAADALGIERDALIESLHEGSSLEDIAKAEGVAYDAVKQAILDVVNTRLADEVADEDLTQERADEILARVTDWLDDGGEAGNGFFGRGGHRGPNF
jgi:hypothetical protein